jgi:hypothetical protein
MIMPSYTGQSVGAARVGEIPGMASRGVGTDPSQRTKKQKFKLRRPADLLTIAGGVSPSLPNKPSFFSLHNLDKCYLLAVSHLLEYFAR